MQTTGTEAQIEGPHHLYVDLEFKVAAVTADGLIAEDTPSYPSQDTTSDGEKRFLFEKHMYCFFLQCKQNRICIVCVFLCCVLFEAGNNNMISIVFLTAYQIDYDSHFRDYEGRPDYNDYSYYDFEAPPATGKNVPQPPTVAPMDTESTGDLQVEVVLEQDVEGVLECSVLWSSEPDADYVIRWKREECHSDASCGGENGPWAAVARSASEVNLLA